MGHKRFVFEVGAKALQYCLGDVCLSGTVGSRFLSGIPSRWRSFGSHLLGSSNTVSYPLLGSHLFLSYPLLGSQFFLSYSLLDSTLFFSDPVSYPLLGCPLFLSDTVINHLLGDQLRDEFVKRAIQFLKVPNDIEQASVLHPQTLHVRGLLV